MRVWQFRGYDNSQLNLHQESAKLALNTGTAYTLSLRSMLVPDTWWEGDSHVSATGPATTLMNTRVAREGGLMVAHLCMRSLHTKGSVS